MAKVYLIGAGPGDPGLLTLKAKAVLETADTVVYDFLANKAFLDFAREDAEIIYVGKKGGDHTLAQDKINELLVAKAKQGRTVARLKGGDPYVFGRGGEEALVLVEAGVEFEIVPGVTSAVAAPAYAGIPITHREFASSVTFITGHEDPTKDGSANNWPALAQSASTLVFFMGVKNLPDICRRLIAGGRAPQTPAALVRWGTTCHHRSMAATLADVAEKGREQGFTAPTLLVVGEVVGLRDKLGWFENRPLLGKGVVVTRSREQASDLVRQLEDLGACCFEFPTIAVKPLADPAPVRRAIEGLRCFDWLVFTSANGVKYFWAELTAMGLDSRALGGLQVSAIGPATGQALAARGIKADFVPDKFVAEGVAEGLMALGVAGKRVLIPRARQAREVLPEELTRAGAEVQVLPVYETCPAEQDPDEVLAAMAEGEIHFLTFTSSSTVDNFFAQVAPERLAPLRDRIKIACIGPITAKTLEKHGFTPDIQPQSYTIPALAQALAQDLRT